MTLSTVNNNRDTKRVGATGNVVAVIPDGATDIDPRAKFVEAIYSVGDTVVTYTYYLTSAKLTSLTVITVTYVTAQDTSFTSAEWS